VETSLYFLHFLTILQCNRGARADPPRFAIQEFPMFLTYLLSRYRAWLRYRATVNELSRLSDRELNDVGLSRSEIEHTARYYASA
jgi:uncharacterized protein YjiS (DUF1127 family)